MMKKIRNIFLIPILIGNIVYAQPTVHIIGQMRDALWKGELYGKINLDTLTRSEHLYGIGPLAYLRGEVMIYDGVVYRSVISQDNRILVDTGYKTQAPFFGYCYIPQWREISLTGSFESISQLEAYLTEIVGDDTPPFMFKIEGRIEEAALHVMNLPEGTEIRSPQDAHRSQVDYTIRQEKAFVLGFYSREHQTIFTHHDTYLHLHLLTADKKIMGHVDRLKFSGNEVRLYIPLP